MMTQRDGGVLAVPARPHDARLFIHVHHAPVTIDHPNEMPGASEGGGGLAQQWMLGQRTDVS